MVMWWTPELVQERLCEAAQTLRALPRPSGPRPMGNHWPDFVRDHAESFNTTAERVAFDAGARVRISATPKQIDEMEQAIGWLSWLENDQPKLVWARANGCPWWRLELRPMRLRRWKRKYPRATLRWFYRRALGIIAARLAA